jgi:secondary thiamine-phosphate synthase enzyme
MNTLTLTSVARHLPLSIRTSRPTEFLDITDFVTAVVEEARLWVGLVNVQTRHTTTAIVVNEHEPLLLEDFAGLLDLIAPAAWSYSHDDATRRQVNLTPDERVNGHSHCRALFLPSSACLNVADGALQLGRWQRIFLVELDGPREREISVLVSGESRS